MERKSPSSWSTSMSGKSIDAARVCLCLLAGLLLSGGESSELPPDFKPARELLPGMDANWRVWLPEEHGRPIIPEDGRYVVGADVSGGISETSYRTKRLQTSISGSTARLRSMRSRFRW